MNYPLGLLRCPATGRALSLDPVKGLLGTKDGPSYSYDDKIGRFLEPATDTDENRATRTFYDKAGWSKDASGLYQDTALFVDTRKASLAFTRACMRRLKKHFRKGGQFLLDAGCGPIAHDELLEYGEAFERRVCIDLSVAALGEARRKLGDKGIYLQGDLTNLPVETGSVDAAMCYHVLYQLPEALQPKAFEELWRVLKPGGVAVVVYNWPNPKLPWRVQRLARILLGKPKKADASAAQPAQSAAPGGVTPDHNLLTREWFESRKWPFRYSFDTYRIVSNTLMRTWIPDDWRGALFLKGLMAFQRIAPAYCGKHGEMPAIIIHKDAG